jgi:hypothetical protein
LRDKASFSDKRGSLGHPYSSHRQDDLVKSIGSGIQPPKKTERKIERNLYGEIKKTHMLEPVR